VTVPLLWMKPLFAHGMMPSASSFPTSWGKNLKNMGVKRVQNARISLLRGRRMLCLSSCRWCDVCSRYEWRNFLA
jgi:hypothetical protein